MDGVDAPAHARGLCHRVGVNHIHFQFLVKNLFLHPGRQVFPDFFGAVDAVQQESRAGLSQLEDLHAFEERILVAGDKTGLVDEIRGVDRPWGIPR